MARNLVICCDGTNNKFGVKNTNVVKLCMTLVKDRDRQLLFYDPGVGTMGYQSTMTKFQKVFSKAIDGVIGRTLHDNVDEAYGFLADHYQPGDKTYLFGFSRGAYTVRALAAMIHMYGLIGPGNANLIPYIAGMFNRSDRDQEKFLDVARDFKATYSREVPIHFIGVWDTVSTIGWFFDPKSLPYTHRNPSIANIRHAVSIDECRAFFRTNLWGEPDPGQNQKEVWFAGSHSDIGGGYPEDQSGLSQIALEWMLHEAETCGLIVDPTRRQEVLGGKAPFVVPSYAAVSHNSLSGLWNLLEILPKIGWSETKHKRTLRMNLWSRRHIPQRAVFHESAFRRRDDPACKYHPPGMS